MKIGIVGCGMAGPVCAILLKRAGHDVEIFEQAPALGPVGAGILLQPPGLAILNRLGCFEEVVRLGARIDRLRGIRPDGSLVMLLPYSALPGRNHAIGIHRGCLFGILLRLLRELEIPIHVDHDTRRVWTGNDGLARIGFADGREAGPYDLALLTDGGSARALSPGLRGKPRRCKQWGAWWLSLPDPGRTFPGTLHQVFVGSRRLLGVLPTGFSQDCAGPNVSLFWGIRLDEAERWRGQGIQKCREEMLRIEPRLEGILSCLHCEDQLTLARYYSHVASRWSHGRVALVGDAAHAMSPHLGQGANLAFQDAAALADSLASNPGDLAAALRRYQRKREHHVRLYHFFSRVMSPLFQSDLASAALLRDTLLPAACKIPPLQRRMLRVLRGDVQSLTRLALG